MANLKCEQCGVTFPSEEALRSHVTKKVSEESPHFAKMLADRQIDIVLPGQKESPR